MTAIVTPVTPADEAAAVDTIVLAFAADPVARWCWPESHRYLANMPAFVRAFAGRAFPHGGAYCTDDRTGAALWLPPGSIRMRSPSATSSVGPSMRPSAAIWARRWSSSRDTTRAGRTGTCR